jgi:hypothetical protein
MYPKPGGKEKNSAPAGYMNLTSKPVASLVTNYPTPANTEAGIAQSV